MCIYAVAVSSQRSRNPSPPQLNGFCIVATSPYSRATNQDDSLIVIARGGSISTADRWICARMNGPVSESVIGDRRGARRPLLLNPD